MAKKSKKYIKSLSMVDRSKLYPALDALALLPKVSLCCSGFDATVELAVNLGVDPRHADQMVRGVVALPAGTGKQIRIIVFAKGDKALEVSSQFKEDVLEVGGDDLAKKISEGWLDFDQVVATPDMMGVVGKLGKVLGPRGLMPNPKLGTVTTNPVQAIKELKAGRIDYKADKSGIVHVAVGKLSMGQELLHKNLKAVYNALLKARPAVVKGTYVQKICLSSTMSPGIKIDPMSI